MKASKRTSIALALAAALALPGAPLDAQAASAPSAAQVIAKATKASGALRSMTSTINFTQQTDMQMGGRTVRASAQSTVAQDWTRQPFRLRQTATARVRQPGQPASSPTVIRSTLYATPQAAYEKEAGAAKWKRVGSAQAVRLRKAAGDAQELKVWKALQRQFSVQKTSQAFVLTLKKTGVQADRLVKGQIRPLLAAASIGRSARTAIGSASYQSVDLKVYVDRKTYRPQKAVATLRFSTKGQWRSTGKQTAVISYRNFNSVPAIAIPAAARSATR